MKNLLIGIIVGAIVMIGALSIIDVDPTYRSEEIIHDVKHYTKDGAEITRYEGIKDGYEFTRYEVEP